MVLFDAVAHHARRQHGAVTAEQLARSGLTEARVRTLLRRGVLTRAAPGVMTVVTSPETWERSLMVATLSSGPSAVASHRSAAALWQLDRFRANHLDVTVPRGNRRGDRAWRTHESDELPSRDVQFVRAIPATSATRTVIDLGRYLPTARLLRIADDAVRRDLTSYEQIHERATELGRRGRRGIARVRDVLEARPIDASVPDSPLEDDVRRLLTDAGLPAPVLHHRVTCDDVTYVLDLAWPDSLVALECDGFRFHRTPDQLARDNDRTSHLALRGWLVLRTTRARVGEDPQRLVRTVGRAIEARS